jgi:hypothetical protein
MPRMPFEPAFMKDLPTFREELARLGSLADWQRFRARWFADQPWPRRSPEALAALAAEGQTVVHGGRTFHRAPLQDDLTPEARYEYFAAFAAVFPVLFPEAEEQPGAGGAGVRFQCPACETWTDQPGDEDCPACGRRLLRLRMAPPPPRAW